MEFNLIQHQKQHPFYTANINDWYKYRYVLNGGREYVEQYLVKYSERESTTAFEARRSMTYCAAHAEAALIDIRNTIYQRLNDIIRDTDIDTFNRAIGGDLGGVDNLGNTMNSFIGRIVLLELLFMSRVGIYVDRSPLESRVVTRAEKLTRHPYVYIVRAEDIISWYVDNAGILQSVLLYYAEEELDEYGLVTAYKPAYKLLSRTDAGIIVTFFDDKFSVQDEKTTILNLAEIPFTILDTSRALLKNVADYQNALMNMESSDVYSAIKSNFAFYTEQFDPRYERFLQGATASSDTSLPANERELDSKTAADISIRTGNTVGRRYPVGAERPGFINPSPEPLMASIAKEENIKKDIRKLINLNITMLESRRASAESKKVDSQGLESGMICIGMELEYAERQIAKHWAMYEGIRVPRIVIQYPTGYDTKDDSERQDEAKKYIDLCEKIPSASFKREMAKSAARTILSNRVSVPILTKILSEIEVSTPVFSDPKQIQEDHKEGLVSTDTASRLRGYPAGEAEKAKVDHAERAARIVQAQQAAAVKPGGVTTITDTDNGAERKEKESTTDSGTGPGVRGNAQ